MFRCLVWLSRSSHWSTSFLSLTPISTSHQSRTIHLQSSLKSTDATNHRQQAWLQASTQSYGPKIHLKGFMDRNHACDRYIGSPPAWVPRPLTVVGTWVSWIFHSQDWCFYLRARLVATQNRYILGIAGLFTTPGPVDHKTICELSQKSSPLQGLILTHFLFLFAERRQIGFNVFAIWAKTV